jgi:uncharacterized membrane protein YjgN (DUF898 family)
MNDSPQSKPSQFYFLGSGSGYFKIWIVNMLLIILTLGIYSAWATVRQRRYFYGNLELDGVSFDYLATPMMILKGRFIAIAFLILYAVFTEFFPIAGIGLAIILGLASPWIILNSMRFNARMSIYRNVRFGFDGSLKPLYIYLIGIPLIPMAIAGGLAAGIYFTQGESPMLFAAFGLGMFGFYLTIPLIQAKIANFYLNNVRFGQGRFEAEVTSGTYYMTYLKVLLFCIGLLVLAGIVVALIGGGIGELMSGDGGAPEGTVGLMVLAWIGILLFGIWVRAYVSARIRNYVFGSACLDQNIQMRSTVEVSALFTVLVVNFLLLILTLGFAFPWTAVRLARFKADNTQAIVSGDLAGYVSAQQENQTAIGDELGDAFDLGVDVAF